MYFVYVIQNDLGRIYIGQTEDISRRLERHNGVLKTKKTGFTHKNKGKWQVVYSEEYQTRQEVLKREKELKSHKGRDWIKQILKVR